MQCGYPLQNKCYKKHPTQVSSFISMMMYRVTQKSDFQNAAEAQKS